MTTHEIYGDARNAEYGLRSLRARMWKAYVKSSGFVAGDVPTDIATLDSAIATLATIADDARDKIDATIKRHSYTRVAMTTYEAARDRAPQESIVVKTSHGIAIY